MACKIYAITKLSTTAEEEIVQRLFSVQEVHLFIHPLINSTNTISGAESIMLNEIDYILAFKKCMVWWGSRPKKSDRNKLNHYNL